MLLYCFHLIQLESLAATLESFITDAISIVERWLAATLVAINLV